MSSPTISPDGNWQWDGQQWQPRQQAPQPASPTPKRPRKRHPVLLGFAVASVALLILVVIIVAASSGGSSGTKAPAKPGATTQPTTHPTAAPTAKPTAAPVVPVVLMQDAGSGTKSTTPFTAPQHWTLKYSYDCSGFGYNGNFQVFLFQGSIMMGVLANDLGPGKSTVTDIYAGGSNLHLTINSECSWSVQAIK
jgi:hypothetical protein